MPLSQTRQSPSVLVASRSPAYAAGLAAFLREEGYRADLAHTVDGALSLLGERGHEVLIADERLGDAPAPELAAEVRRHHPRVRMLFAVDGAGVSPGAQLEALAAGASGCVLHSATREAVGEAVRDALRGMGRFDVEALRPVAELVRRSDPRDDLGLTDQERVVLRYMRQGLTYKEIALAIGVSWHTVRTQAQSILRKHGVHSRRELDAWDARRGGPHPGLGDAAMTG